MYTIHRTQGLILVSYPRSEGDRQYVILTEELGLIEASAKSVRETRSRLRYALVPYTLGLYSFVHGRKGWHIVGAHDDMNIHARSVSIEKRAAIERITGMLIRLVRGEGKNEALFSVTVHGFLAFVTIQDELPMIEALEHIIVLRLLYALGYVSGEREHNILAPFIESSEVTDMLLVEAQTHRKHLIKAINEGFAVSQL